MRAPTLVRQDDQVVRFTSSGTVRWRANIGSLGSSEEPTYSSMLASTDGSAFVAQYLLNLVKIGADGTMKWAATTDAYLLASLTDQAVAVLGCNSLSALDAQTGQLLWKQVFSSQPGTCVASGLLSDAAGNSYVTLSTFAQSNSPIAGFQLLKFGITGHVLWRQNADATSPMRPFGVSGSRVYVTSANFSSTDPVRAFAVGDGALTWTAPATHGLCVAGIPAEAIVSGAAGLQRLADADGQPRWSQPSASGAYASARGNRILIGASAIEQRAHDEIHAAPHVAAGVSGALGQRFV